ncbi:hypothetical protein GCM10007424_08560 [Flavobacterium suaedae]|uniref:DUF4738 domain-containing protein n=1 Tax=Flavobacterium suaedae TaxID=1767027 RepID=A0ABQ1JKU0_9FLAO|nr:hypothetical protein [Flavobacterium suaedae]GGB70851.1 hypothetical protein GCM10007424_08560 [Flavobacterium suaedae]
MQIIRLIILSSFLFISCKKDTPVKSSIDPDNVTDTTIKKEATNSKLNKLAKQLSGLWINSSYLDSIKVSKSISKSRNYYSDILGFYLYEENLLSEKSSIWGFTENEGGYTYPIKYNTDTNNFIFDVSRKNEYPEEMDFSMYLKKDKLEIMYTIPKRKKILYTRISHSKNIDELDYELNHILFEGTYVDSITQKEFIFQRNGTVKGFDSITNYELQYNFVVELKPIDMIFLSSSDEPYSDLYHYEIKDDKIMLYSNRSYPDEKTEDEFIPETGYIIEEKPTFILMKK